MCLSRRGSGKVRTKTLQMEEVVLEEGLVGNIDFI